jgi:predicted PurR-regulated permease PerM
MEENNRESGVTESGVEEPFALLKVTLPLLTLTILTGALYLAKDVLIPLTAAVILAVILGPIAARLEQFVGRSLSAVVLLLSGVAILATMAYVTSVELVAVADQVAGYSDNIGDKLAAIERSVPPGLRRTNIAIRNVAARVEKGNPSLHKTVPVAALQVSSSFSDNLRHLTPALSALIEILLVVVLLFFMLYSRHDLRDRFVRLAARGRLTVASQAVESAGLALGRYLLLFSLINLGFGILVGLVLWFLGLPNPEFWGLLAFLFRYIPYVGTLVSSLLPALVAFAVFPGWIKSLEVIGSLVALDQIGAYVAEPLIIGPGIGISPVALLISTIY